MEDNPFPATGNIAAEREKARTILERSIKEYKKRLVMLRSLEESTDWDALTDDAEEFLRQTFIQRL